MGKQVVLVGVLIFCCIQGALAASDEFSANFSTCMERSGGVTVAMMDCLHQETEIQDLRLNKAYKLLMAQLKPERKQELKQVQRAWLAFRDANCRFYADPDGGSIARISASDCFLRATAARVQELEGFLE